MHGARAAACMHACGSPDAPATSGPHTHTHPERRTALANHAPAAAAAAAAAATAATGRLQPRVPETPRPKVDVAPAQHNPYPPAGRQPRVGAPAVRQHGREPDRRTGFNDHLRGPGKRGGRVWGRRSATDRRGPGAAGALGGALSAARATAAGSATPAPPTRLVAACHGLHLQSTTTPSHPPKQG